MNWGTYEIAEPWPAPTVRMAVREQVVAALDQRLAARHDRIEQLVQLLSLNGFDLLAGDGTKSLNEWFVASARPGGSETGRLTPRWESVGGDIVLWLSERAIDWSDGALRWQVVDVGRSEPWYRPAIFGFSVANPDYHIDLDRLIGAYGSRLARGEHVEIDYFLRLLFTMSEKA
jgi:hypothetical protein